MFLVFNISAIKKENFCAILVNVKKKFNAEEKACANWCIGISYETYIMPYIITSRGV